MKQLNLFNEIDINEQEVNLDVFGNDVKIIKKEIQEPKLEQQEIHFEVGMYVRTKYDEIYKIDGLYASQKVFVGYKNAKNRYGEEYKQKIYKNYQRAYAYVLNEYSKKVKYYIREEDVVMQSRFKIDLIFKDDYIKTKEVDIKRVGHKENGKIIEIEVFDNGIKKYVPYSKTYLICGTSKIMEKDIVSLVSMKTKPTDFLEDGCVVRTRLGRWYTVEKVMSKKVLIKNKNTEKFFFLPFSDIEEVKNIE